MFSLILAAAVVAQASPPAPPPTPAQVEFRDFVTRMAELKKQRLATAADQEKAVVARRRAKRAATARANVIRDAQADVELARQETEYKRAMAAQREYEIRMGPIWAAEHANQVQEQRNALIAQRNAIAKYQADYDIWLRMQQNSIDAAAVQALQRR